MEVRRSIVRVWGQEYVADHLMAGTDYLRLTSDRELRLTNERASRNELEAIKVAKSAGLKAPLVKTAILGYQGLGNGTVFAGSSPQGLLFQASGYSAETLLGYAPEDLRPSRLDVQVTAEVEDPDAVIAMITTLGGLMCDERASQWSRVKRRHVSSFGDGDTLYLGVRSSPRFIRIYNKHKEDPEAYPRPAIRFEVEYKDELARKAFADLKRTHRPDRIAYQLVRDELDKFAVWIPRLVDAPLVATPRKDPSDTDDAAKLLWLERQVRPTVKGLLTRGVSRETMSRVLGLEEKHEQGGF